MKDLEYIVSLGFSGTDITRAIIIAFFLAMFVRKEAPIWKMALIALFADRMLWPIVSQAIAGAGLQTIYGSIGAIFQSFFDDLGVYVVRFFGLFVMITLFVTARHRLHKMTPPRKPKSAAA